MFENKKRSKTRDDVVKKCDELLEHLAKSNDNQSTAELTRERTEQITAIKERLKSTETDSVVFNDILRRLREKECFKNDGGKQLRVGFTGKIRALVLMLNRLVKNNHGENAAASSRFTPSQTQMSVLGLLASDPKKLRGMLTDSTASASGVRDKSQRNTVRLPQGSFQILSGFPRELRDYLIKNKSMRIISLYADLINNWPNISPELKLTEPQQLITLWENANEILLKLSQLKSSLDKMLAGQNKKRDKLNLIANQLDEVTAGLNVMIFRINKQYGDIIKTNKQAVLSPREIHLINRLIDANSSQEKFIILSQLIALVDLNVNHLIQDGVNTDLIKGFLDCFKNMMDEVRTNLESSNDGIVHQRFVGLCRALVAYQPGEFVVAGEALKYPSLIESRKRANDFAVINADNYSRYVEWVRTIKETCRALLASTNLDENHTQQLLDIYAASEAALAAIELEQKENLERHPVVNVFEQVDPHELAEHVDRKFEPLPSELEQYTVKSLEQRNLGLTCVVEHKEHGAKAVIRLLEYTRFDYEYLTVINQLMTSKVAGKHLTKRYGLLTVGNVNDGRLLEVDEFLSGGSLEKEIDNLKDDHAKRAEKALGYYQDLQQMMQDFKKLNVFYPDTKPGNFLLDSEGKLKISDKKSFIKIKGQELGTGVALGNTNHLGTTVTAKVRELKTVTRDYCPAEFVNNHDRDSQVDLDKLQMYLIGMTLYCYAVANIFPPKRDENGHHQFDFDHPVFQSENGKELLAIIQALTQTAEKRCYLDRQQQQESDENDNQVAASSSEQESDENDSQVAASSSAASSSTDDRVFFGNTRRNRFNFAGALSFDSDSANFLGKTRPCSPQRNDQSPRRDSVLTK